MKIIIALNNWFKPTIFIYIMQPIQLALIANRLEEFGESDHGVHV